MNTFSIYVQFTDYIHYLLQMIQHSDKITINQNIHKK